MTMENVTLHNQEGKETIFCKRPSDNRLCCQRRQLPYG